jgi:hypothetical protein
MFKKSNRNPQIDLFGGVPSLLEGKAKKQYDDGTGWHNQFHAHIVSRIDESLFKVLFSEKMGAPNAPVSLLVGMMILKEAMGWSDWQLFEQCRFNLLVRRSLGLFNLADEIPAESTYYLLRKRIYEHGRQHGEDLLSKAFGQVTGEQVREFNVNGRSIRMDSKLIGSNIAFFTRYEIIHHALQLFYKTLDKKSLSLLPDGLCNQLTRLMEEEPQKTVYRQTREEIKERMQSTGTLICQLITVYGNQTSEPFQLLCRVFNEHYNVLESHQVELRPKEEINSDSVQSPHDPDATYRKKGDQQVKGYSANITETSSDGPLNLVTDVNIRPANTPDTEFVQQAIELTRKITGQPVEKVYADGAYQSPDNDQFCQDIDMVFTGIQGSESRYQLEMATQGLMVTDTETGKIYQAKLSKKQKNSKQDSWYIQPDNGSRRYFDQKAIRTSALRRIMRERPPEELQKRNNVEATVFQLAYPLRGNKTRYRGNIKQQMWAVCRCFWINLVRIMNFLQQTCQRTFQNIKNEAFSSVFCPEFSFRPTFNRKLGLQILLLVLFIVIIEY